LAIPALVAVWALAGFYGSLGPTLARLVVGSSSVVFGDLALFTPAESAALTVLFIRTMAPRTVMLLGSAVLLTVVGITLLAVAYTLPAVFFIGTAVAGVGFGGGFQGALRTVLPLAAAHGPQGVLSTVYIVCYLAMGLPAVVGGVLVVQVGVPATAREYGLVVMAPAAIAGLGQVWPRRKATLAPRTGGLMSAEATPQPVATNAHRSDQCGNGNGVGAFAEAS
jgi:hypothetical protein